MFEEDLIVSVESLRKHYMRFLEYSKIKREICLKHL